MGRCRGTLAGVLCVASLVVAPAAQAAEGHDSYTRGYHLYYEADPGEANTFSAEIMKDGVKDGWLHLKDKGAIIRWTSIPLPGEPFFGDCFGGVWDVFCVHGWSQMWVILGDRRDSFVNKSDSPAEVYAQDGEVDRITCGTYVGPFDIVWADPQDVIVTPVRCDYVYFEPAP